MIKIQKAMYATICDSCSHVCTMLIITGKKHYLHLCNECYKRLKEEINDCKEQVER